MPNLIHITKCTLCEPPNVFKLEEQGFDFEPGVTNGEIPERLQGFQLKLVGHIQKAAQWEQQQLQKALKHHQKNGGAEPDVAKAKHFQAWAGFMARTALAQGTAIMEAFATTDPGLNLMKETARLKLNTLTRKFYFTDEMLLDAIVAVDSTAEGLTVETVKRLLCDARDALMEQGKYSPQSEQKLVKLT